MDHETLENESIQSKRECIHKLKLVISTLEEDCEERKEWLLANPETVEKAPKFTRSPTPNKIQSFIKTDNAFDKQTRALEDKIVTSIMSKSDMKAVDLIKKAAEDAFEEHREEMEQIRARKHLKEEYLKMSLEDQKIINDDIDLCIEKERAKIWREAEKKIDLVILNSKSVKKKQQHNNFKLVVYHFDEVDELKKINRKRLNEFIIRLELEAKEEIDNFEKSLSNQIDVNNPTNAIVVSKKRKDNEESINKHISLKKELFIQELNLDLKLLLGKKLLESYNNDDKALEEIEALHDVWNRMANRINLAAFKSIMKGDQAFFRINTEFSILHENISDGTNKSSSAWNIFVNLVGDYWASAADESLRKSFDDKMLLYAAIYYSVRGKIAKRKELRANKRAEINEKLIAKIEKLKSERDGLLQEIFMLDSEIKSKVVRGKCVKIKPAKATISKEKQTAFKIAANLALSGEREYFDEMIAEDPNLLNINKRCSKPRCKATSTKVRDHNKFVDDIWANLPR